MATRVGMERLMDRYERRIALQSSSSSCMASHGKVTTRREMSRSEDRDIQDAELIATAES